MPRAGWLALGAVGAALAGTSLPLWGLAGLAALGLIGSAALLVSRRWRAGMLLLGAGLVLLRLLLPVALPIDSQEATGPPPTTERTWRAEVLSLGALGGGGQRAILRLDPGPWTVWAQLPRYPAVAPGDRIELRAAIEPVEAGSGFSEYLERIGAAGTIRVQELSVVAGGSQVEGLRRGAGEILAKTLPAPQAGLAAGILVGLRDQVDRGVAADFTTAGLSHVVAISGWNIALVAGCLAAMLRGLDRRSRAVITVAAIAAYTVLAGASPSVVRAAVMAAIVLGARESGRAGRAAGALGLAVAAILVVEPDQVTDAGFQLSVLATAGLLAWAGGLTAVLRRRLPRRAPDWLVESLGVSLAAQAATLPIVLLAFGRLSLVAPLANLLMAPLVAPAMGIGAIALGLGAAVSAGLPELLALLAATAGWAAFGAMIAVAHVSAAMPFASLELASPWDAAAAAACGVLLLLAGDRRARAAIGRVFAVRLRSPSAARSTSAASVAAPDLPRHGRRMGRHWLIASAVLTIAAVLVAVVFLARPDGKLRMTVLDVGQGDAVLLEGSRGGRILVDAGPDADLLLALLDARLPPWDRRLDLVILTHPHEDHVAGIALLLERYRVGALAEPGMRGPGPGYAAYEAALARFGRGSRALVAGDHLSLDGAPLSVRWPRAGEVPAEPSDTGTGINNVSIVLDMRFGEHRFLLTGDVEEEIDPELLAGGLTATTAGNDGTVDVLKVAHHGSRTASTGPFIEAVLPRVAIVSSGAGNRYGHPDPGTLDRLRAAGARVLRTDTDGNVTITSDGTTLTVASSGGRPRPSPRADGPAAPTISGWASPTGSAPLAFSCVLSRPTGSSRTARAWPKWPPSSVGASRARTSTTTWSPRPAFSTTSTSSSRPTMSWRRWATGRRAPRGSSVRATRSWPRPSPRIPSGASAAATRRGRRASAWRRRSSPTPTSASPSGSSRSTNDSTTWRGAIPATRPRSVPRGPPFSASKRRSAPRAASARTKSDAIRG